MSLAGVPLERQLRHLVTPGLSRVYRRPAGGTCQVRGLRRGRGPRARRPGRLAAQHGRREAGARAATWGRQPADGATIRASRCRADRTRRGGLCRPRRAEFLAGPQRGGGPARNLRDCPAWLPQSSSSSLRKAATCARSSNPLRTVALSGSWRAARCSQPLGGGHAGAYRYGIAHQPGQGHFPLGAADAVLSGRPSGRLMWVAPAGAAAWR